MNILKKITNLIIRLLPALILIIAASAYLLISDLSVIKTSKKFPVIAIMQFVSNSAMDLTVKGLRLGLADKGWIEGKTCKIDRFNAEADMPMMNSIANNIVHGDYQLILTASTVSLQVMANSNKTKKISHVFAAVTDPFGAGVGIIDSIHHPPYIAGIGTFQPVETAIRIAKEMNPGLSKLGTIWNTGEANSEACVKKARIICKQLGIVLTEVNIDGTSGASEAARALAARGVDAIWGGGDNIFDIAIDIIIKSAMASNIPVFTNYPDHALHGAIFSVGANYMDVGRLAGNMGGDILNGKNPADILIKNIVPEKLYVNEAIFGKVKGWNFTEKVRKRTDSIVVTKN
jgi:ABC-type uncharacterized transport system substrate-binding protein